MPHPSLKCEDDLANKRLIDQIADMEQLLAAYEGLNHSSSAGCDGITFRKFEADKEKYIKEMSKALTKGKYRPDALRIVYIKKRNKPSEYRKLSVPTIQDRVVQAAMLHVLEQIYLPTFSQSSFGYIYERGCFPALKHVLEEVNKGKQMVVNIDLRKFFDTIPHDKLLEILEKKIHEKEVLDLIQRFLACKALDHQKGNSRVTEGVAQGGPISPLLSNIFLNELDQYLDNRNIAFARYADDCIILCNNKSEANFIFSQVSEYLENTLGLKINYSKSDIVDITEITYLGYSFKQVEANQYVFDVKEKQFNNMKEKIAMLLGQIAEDGFDKGLVVKMSQIIAGWVNYYSRADIRDRLQEFDDWFAQNIEEIGYSRNDELVDIIRSLQFDIDIKRGSVYSNCSEGFYLNDLYEMGYRSAVSLYDHVREKWNLD